MSNVPVKDSNVIFREIWSDYEKSSSENECHVEIYLALVTAMAGILFGFGAAVFKTAVFIAVPLVALGLAAFLISARFVFAWIRTSDRKNKNVK